MVTETRIADYKKGNLKYRPIGKPIHTPSVNDKVAKVPDEWFELKEVNGKYNNAKTEK